MNAVNYVCERMHEKRKRVNYSMRGVGTKKLIKFQFFQRRSEVQERNPDLLQSKMRYINKAKQYKTRKITKQTKLNENKEFFFAKEIRSLI